MRDFLFLRHGETDWNAQSRMQGQIAHVPLNSNGVAQAHAAAAMLAKEKIDLIISSTLERAKQTTAIVKANKSSTPVLYDERLIERCWGQGEGLTLEEISAKPDSFFTPGGARDFVFDTRQPMGAETREELADRATAALEDLLTTHHGKRLLLVTHGAWIRALVFRLSGVDQVFRNAVVYRATQLHLRGDWKADVLDQE